METGYYRKKPIRWEKYEVDLFVPHLFFEGMEGCGANTLALLTGIPPRLIKNTNRLNANDWKDTFMIKFLKTFGFKVIKLTKCEVTNCDGFYTSENITDKHVILMSQLLNKNMASWSVIHNSLWYHNFQTCSFKSLSLLNMPTLTTYFLFHPQWKADNWQFNTPTVPVPVLFVNTNRAKATKPTLLKNLVTLKKT